jgi:hypothetical protein
MPIRRMLEGRRHAKSRPGVSLSHCGPLPGGLARMEGALAAAARAAALIAADVFGPTAVGRVAARRMRASARV